MRTCAVELDQVGFLSWAELGLLAAQPALGPGDRHPLSGAGASKIGLEFGNHRRSRKQQTADRVCRVVQRAIDVKTHAAGGESVDDVASVRDGASEPVELGHHQGVASAAGRESFAQARAVAVGTGQAVVDIDRFRVDARICSPTLHLPDLL
ncbi:hypothetical protein AWC17_01185 [Mycobacterium nebraskense]|uniref:Uncharacterized protein n=1 Tax=Mycobacterium nebraskense TaxID=244292 RepID=A0A1X1ZWP6_9MYCO|nr:hypothetical protein WU83_25770 [Mycobacterium nebraskense]ORW28243.1 hypothetical protein AWC17_01185 [Mycobacterium nebraskense]